MATFLPGQTDKFGPLQLHTPDYSFLTQAYGAKQAQYDKGFNAVKNLYNSVLNSPVSSAENEDFRKNAFIKIQDALKSVSGVDLSDPNTVKKAMGIMNPITDDKELGYDMAVTKYHQTQKQTMEQYKNSTDPEKRKLYSEQAERYIQFAEEDLRNARRGTGEIQSVRPKDFVIFEDVIGFLDKQAKAQGLKIEKTMVPGDGYIYKLTNGPNAVPAFNDWAKLQMGDQFDRQFNVQGEVQAQTAIRNIAKTQGISTQDARKVFSQQVYQPMMDKLSREGEFMEKQVSEASRRVELYESKYGTKEPTDPELLAIYTKYRTEKEQGSTALENLRQRTADFQNKGVAYVNRNLEGLYSEEAKAQTTMNWASSTAMATESQDQKSDQVTISKWQMQNTRDMNFAQIGAANARHASSQNWEKEKFGMTQDLAWQKQGFTEYQHEQEMGYKYDALDAKGDSATGAKGKSSMSPVGSFTSKEAGVPGASIVQQALLGNNVQLFNSTFSPQNGLLKLIVPDDMSHGKYYGSLSRLNDFAATGENKLTEQDQANLKEYAKKVGSKTYQINGRQSASLFLDNLAINTFNTAQNNAKDYPNIKARTDLFAAANSFEKGLSSVSSLLSERDQLAKEMKRLQEAVMGEDGKMKPEFVKAGLKVFNQFGDGTLQFDTSGMSKENLSMLEPYIGSEFRARTNPVGQVYSMRGLSDAEIFSSVNQNSLKSASFSGDKLAGIDFSKMGNADFRKLFGDESTVSFNPVTKEFIMQYKTSQANPAAKALGVTKPEEMTIVVPYETAMANPSLRRLSEVSQVNSVNAQSAGKAAVFLTDRNARITANEIQKSSGFDYEIFGMTDENNRYGVRFVLKTYDAEKNQEIVQSIFQPIANPGNASEWIAVNQSIDTAYYRYQTAAKEQERKFIESQISK